jgi:patatin-like phospholipase/acyl hydrolase
MTTLEPHPVVKLLTPTTTGGGQFPDDGTEPFQVLALDGGGFRGLFSAVVLAKWEQQLGRPIGQHFDLIVGTSTGAIIALGLAAGMSAADLVEFYEKDGKEIFPARWSVGRLWHGMLHYLHRKYGSSALERALKRRFGELTISDLAKPVVVPGFNLEVGRHWYFKTPHFGANLIDRYRPLWEVARATSAAPTYFPAFRTSENELFVDGGLVANNPSLVGYFEVALNFPAYRDRIKVLNIGTEGGECALPKRRLATGGLLAWAKKAPDALMQAQAVSTEALMAKLLGPDRWLRVKPEHGRNFAPLDIYDPVLYSGLAVNQAARHFAAADRQFFQHTAREGLIQHKTK